MSTGGKIRRTFTDLTNPQQLRELNRQMEWIWNLLFGNLDQKSLSKPFSNKIDETRETATGAANQAFEANAAAGAASKAAASASYDAYLAQTTADYASDTADKAMALSSDALDAVGNIVTSGLTIPVVDELPLPDESMSGKVVIARNENNDAVYVCVLMSGEFVWRSIFV